MNSSNIMGYEEKTEKPVCHFIRGVIAGAATVVVGSEMECIETKCEAKGDEYSVNLKS